MLDFHLCKGSSVSWFPLLLGHSLSGLLTERWVFHKCSSTLETLNFCCLLKLHETVGSSAQLPALLAALSAQVHRLLSLCLYNLESTFTVKVPSSVDFTSGHFPSQQDPEFATFGCLDSFPVLSNT